jgi:hypothetical protein
MLPFLRDLIHIYCGQKNNRIAWHMCHVRRGIIMPVSQSLKIMLAFCVAISVPAIAAEQPVKVGSFSSVTTSVADVTIKVGPAPSVVLIGEPSELAKMEVTVKNGDLIISPKRKPGMGWNRSYDVKNISARVTTPALSRATVAGSGDMFISGINTKSFEAAIGGAGTLTSLDAKVDALEMSIGGSGTIAMAGVCSKLEVNVGGSGTVKAQKMRCKSAEINIGGSGDVQVFASESADSSIAGSGDVIIYGNPKNRNKSIAGSGNVSYQ